MKNRINDVPMKKKVSSKRIIRDVLRVALTSFLGLLLYAAFSIFTSPLIAAITALLALVSFILAWSNVLDD